MSAGGEPIDWDFTLVPFAPLIVRMLDAVAPRVVIEVGSDRGDFTRELLGWASGRDAEVIAIDPEPAPELLELAEERPELRLVSEPSPDALADLPEPGVIVLDGDHNHYTLSRELSSIAEGASRTGLPLILIHDIGWPHARRDTYYAPARVPEEHRQPLAHDVLLAPGEAGTASVGVGFEWAAAREGGPRNGVLTAVEEFMSGREGLRLATLPAFFGLGVLWPEDAPWARGVAAIVGPWDGSPLLARLEEIRLAQIIDRTRLNRREEVLRSMLGSRAFGLVERLSRLRNRPDPLLSRDRVRRVLEDRRP
jgi:hypothetical protein